MLSTQNNQQRKLSSKNQRVYSTIILLLGLIWIGVTAAFFNGTTNRQLIAPKKGFMAQDFVLQTAIGESHRLSDCIGKPVLINFWTSWCPPCRTEMPAMQKVYDTYKNKGFVILAVNATHQDSITKASQFADENDLTFPTLMDIEGSITKQYKVHSFPTSFFIDKDGVIHEVVIGGPMSEALLRTRVEALFQESE